MDAKQLGPTFASNLRLLRNRNGWSQRYLAELMETSPAVIIHWEKGQKSPTLTTITKLCLVFNVTPNVMLGEETAEILSTVPA